MPGRRGRLLQNPLARFEEHFTKLKTHVNAGDLATRIASRDYTRKGDDDEKALSTVLSMPSEFLPRGAYRDAEELSNQYLSRLRGTRMEARRYIVRLHGFLRRVVAYADRARNHWLHIVEHGKMKTGVNSRFMPRTLESALQRRRRLAELMRRYTLSEIWRHNQLPREDVRKLLAELVREGFITSEGRTFLFRGEKHGIDPNTFKTYLARRTGVHHDELTVAERWTAEDLEKITGKPIRKVLRQRHPEYYP